MAADPVSFDKKNPARKPCPICRKPSIAEMAPFCSKRCADIDLHKWLGGVYAVPADETGTTDRSGEDSPHAYVK